MARRRQTRKSIKRRRKLAAAEADFDAVAERILPGWKDPVEPSGSSPVTK